MKRLPYITPLLLFVFFFFFSSEVKADTITLDSSNISSSMALLNSDFEYVKNNIASQPQCSGRNLFFVFYYNNEYYGACYQFIGNPSSTAFTFQYTESTNRIFYYINAGMKIYKYQNGSLSLTSNPINTLNIYTNTEGFTYNNLLYTSGITAYYINTQGNTLTFTYAGNTYTIENNSAVPSLYDIYLNSQTPTDNYPILTSFFTLFLDRLGYLANYITGSYVMLSVIVVILLITLFTFIKERRFLP